MPVTIQNSAVIRKINDPRDNQRYEMYGAKDEKAEKYRKVLWFGYEKEWDAFLVFQTSIMGRYLGL